MMNELVTNTYNAMVALTQGRATAEETRAKLRSLRQEAGDRWEAVKLAAIARQQRGEE